MLKNNSWHKYNLVVLFNCWKELKLLEKKVGRPSTGLYRKKQIKIYVTDDEYNRIKQLAELKGISVNKFILEKTLK